MAENFYIALKKSDDSWELLQVQQQKWKGERQRERQTVKPIFNKRCAWTIFIFSRPKSGEIRPEVSFYFRLSAAVDALSLCLSVCLPVCFRCQLQNPWPWKKQCEWEGDSYSCCCCCLSGLALPCLAWLPIVLQQSQTRFKVATVCLTLRVQLPFPLSLFLFLSVSIPPIKHTCD